MKINNLSNSYNPEINHAFDPIRREWIDPYKDIDWDLLFLEACIRYPIGCKFKAIYDNNIIFEVNTHDKDEKYWKVKTMWSGQYANTINLNITPIDECNFATVWCNGEWAGII